MRAASTEASWGWVARLLHWALAALILFQLSLGVYMANFVDDLIAQFRLTQTHKSWGFVIFALALVRVGWRLASRSTPRMPPGTPRWQAGAARASHAVLYALMLVLPLSGWAYASASPLQDMLGIENMVFGLFALPDPWVPGDEAVARAAHVVHVWSGRLLAGVFVLHAAAALKHHAIDRDDVLARMSWGRR